MSIHNEIDPDYKKLYLEKSIHALTLETQLLSNRLIQIQQAEMPTLKKELEEYEDAGKTKCFPQGSINEDQGLPKN